MLPESTQQQTYVANAIDKTLAEQLQITEREISARKAMLGFTAEDERALLGLKEIVAVNADDVVGRFYQAQLNYPEIALLIGDADTLRRLQAAMRRYLLELFEGFYDIEYVNKRLRIGKVHKRIGVPPKLYVSAILLLQSTIETVLYPLLREAKAYGEWEFLHQAMRKLLMFDMQLVFDTYISSLVAEVEVAKSEMEDYATSLEQVIAERTQQLQELARIDSLTGLLNRRAFSDELRRELAVAERSHTPVCLAYVDLNGFKKLNDTKGHREGDRVLELVGSAMRSATREVDIACRYGGDEFCIIMPRTDLTQAGLACERLIEIFQDAAGDAVTLSIGIVQTGPEAFNDPDALIKAADGLMYQAKSKSKAVPGHFIEQMIQAA